MVLACLLAVAAVLPLLAARAPRHMAVALGALIPLVWLQVATWGTDRPLGQVALLVGFGWAAALALGAAAPQLPAALGVILATGILAGPFVQLPQAGLARLALGAAAIALLALLSWRHELGIRVLCAVASANALLAALPASPTPHRWVPAAVAAGVLAATLALARGRRVPRPSWRAVGGWALGGGAVLTLGLVACAFWTPVLPEAATTTSARRARLLREAPRGGLVWPLLSEYSALNSNLDPATFPVFDNLDAFYLAGREARGIYRLPGTTLASPFSLHALVRAQRLVKDAGELTALRRAAQATVGALDSVLPLIRPGASAREIAARIHAAQLERGCATDSFDLIVASGAEAASPHGSGNRTPLRAGDLVVVDIGCLADHYASDFTRTLPVGGHFDARGRAVVQAVYDAQQAALRACKPGAHLFGPLGNTLDSVARSSLKRSGLPPGFPHGLGHTVGLFVHDVGGGEALAPGMVITLEPGIYVPGELGSRIEDTFVVTATGCEPLTTGFAADPASIEARMGALAQRSP